MPQNGCECGVLRFANFEVDLRTGELRRGGRKVKLQGQPFQILAMLVERPGELVTRESLRKRLWPADTFVDFEHSLNTAVKKLRQALGDAADHPRFIETLPRRGYRFTGAVEEVEPMAHAIEKPAAGWVGEECVLCANGRTSHVVVPVDEAAFREKEKLEAAGDNLGFSLMIATERLLLVPCGTRVKVLAARTVPSLLEVRILEGEFTGLAAVVLGKHLARTAGAGAKQN